MKYITKINAWGSFVYVVERWERFEYLVFYDTDTGVSTTVLYDDIESLLPKDVYGVVYTKNKSSSIIDYIFAIPSYAMALYDILDFKKVRSQGKTAKQFLTCKHSSEIGYYDDFIEAQKERGVFNGPTRALRASSYTLFVTDNIMVTEYERDIHTLASYLVYNKKYGEDIFTNVKYYDDYIDIKLFDSVYTFKILDMKKFNNIITKAVCLSK